MNPRLCRVSWRLLTSIILVAASHPVAAGVLPGDRFQIHDAGQPRLFEVARDELHITTAAWQHRTQSFTPLADAEAVRERAAALSQSTGDEFELVLYEVGAPRNEFTRRIVTKQVLVELEPGNDAVALAGAVGAASQNRVPQASGYFIFAATETGGALALAEALRGQAGVVSAEPLLARQHQKRLIPNDAMFASQWHLRNTGQNGGTPGIDVNVTNVWNTYRGSGVGIAIIDDGLQHAHPDLQANYDPTTSTNLNDHTADPNPDVSFDYHGTSCAGVAAARGNNGLGVAGPAFEAKLAGIRLLGGSYTDADEAAAMSWRNDVLYLKSNSWGPFDDGQTVEGPGTLTTLALAQGALNGRGGKGTIYVWAGGNGLEFEDNANYDGYVNSIYTIGVGAVDDHGNQSEYSEPGACLVVAAPSDSFSSQGITTTDLVGSDGYSGTDYTSTFGGTSSAAPLAAGVVALILEANPNLGWRDVQEILMRSATKVSPSDTDWATNGAGLNFNHNFGAGLINAGAAVALATNWANLGPQRTNSSVQNGLSVPIPDDDPTGITRTFVLTNSNLRVEHVTLTVNITHTYRGDLAITLTSPNGTQSRLAEAHGDGSANYSNWKFMSVRNWGENPAGTWTVKIADEVGLDVGTLNSIRLDVYGATTGPQILNASAVARPTSAIITWDTTGAATSQVEYGFTTNLGFVTPMDATLTTQHSVLIMGLVPGTNYYFRAVSLFGSNQVRSAVSTFSTDVNLIVDNPQARYSGVWTLGTSAPDKFGSYYQSAATVNGVAPSSVATYTPGISIAANYDVYIWYPAGANRTANAQVAIYFDGGSEVRSVNQTVNGGAWQLLATNLALSVGTDAFATIANNTGESGKVVMADAMRWSYSPGQDAPPDGSPPTWWVDYYFGGETDTSFDHDEDGYATQQEYVLGTDPTNPGSRLEVRAQRNGSGLKITFGPVVGGRIYQLATATNLNGGVWTALPGAPVVNGATGEFNISNTLGGGRYYRLLVRLSP